MRYLAVLMMLMSVAACGSDDKTGNTTTGSTTATTGATTSTAGTTTGTATTTTGGSTTTAGGSTTTTTGGTTAGTTTAGSGTTPIQVTISDYAFSPANITATVSTPIVFTNTGNAAHTATSTGGDFTFDSGQMAHNAVFTFTPSAAGNGTYHCTNHPGSMTGTLTVTQ